MSDDCIDDVGVTQDVTEVTSTEDTPVEVIISEETTTLAISCDEIIVEPTNELFTVDTYDEVVTVDVTDEVITVTTDCAQGPKGASGVALWEEDAEYVINEIVFYDGSFYIALTNSLGDQPDVSPSDWDLISSSGDFLTEAQANLLYRSDYVEVLTTHATITRPGSYLIFNTIAPTHLEIDLPNPEDFPGSEIFLLNAPFGFLDVNGIIDGQTFTTYPPNSFIGLRSFQLPPAFGGSWLWGSAQRAGMPFDLPPWWNQNTGTSDVPADYILKIAPDISTGINIPQWLEAPDGIPDGTMVNDVPTWNGTEYTPMPIIEKTTTLFDETTNPGIIYIGKAMPTGSAISEAAAVWAIKTIDTTTDTEIKWADGVTTYTKVWNNRASYSYF